MTISTKFDLEQIVYTIVEDDIRKMLIRSVAEKWLESRGCVINLDGKYVKIKERKLKKK